MFLNFFFLFLQGQERDVVILSFVRANPQANIGFLSQRQRLNVALTRARRSCFIVASLSSLSQNDDWKSLIQNAQDRNVIRTITQAEENNRAHIRNLVQKWDECLCTCVAVCTGPSLWLLIYILERAVHYGWHLRVKKLCCTFCMEWTWFHMWQFSKGKEKQASLP